MLHAATEPPIDRNDYVLVERVDGDSVCAVQTLAERGDQAPPIAVKLSMFRGDI